MKLSTFLSISTGMAATAAELPIRPMMAKTFSWFTSFCAASTVFLGS